MLGNFLSGLSNLGQIYRGYEQSQDELLRQQYYRQALQQQQEQQKTLTDVGKLVASGRPLGGPQLQPGAAQPIPTPGTPPVGPPTPLTPASYTQPQPPPLAGLGQPASSAGFFPGAGGLPSGPLGMPGLPGVGDRFQGGNYNPVPQTPPPLRTASAAPPPGDMGVSPFGPGMPFTGSAGGAGEGLPPQQQAGAASLAGPPAGGTAQMNVATLGQPGGGRPGGIAQPSGGFGLTPGYTPGQSQAPRAAGGGLAPGFARDPTTGLLTRNGQPPDSYGPDPATGQNVPRWQTTAAPAGGTGPLYGKIIQLESGGSMDTSTVGSYGEIGPAQITPDTWKQYAQPGENIRDAQTNLAVGKRITDDLWAKSGGDPAAVLVGYNRGEGAMKRFQAAGDNLDALVGTSMMPTAAYQRAVIQAGGKGSPIDVRSAHADMSRNLSPQDNAIGTRGAQQLLSMFPQMPQVVSSFQTANQLAQSINQGLPGISDQEKGAVFLKLFPLMSEQAKEDAAQKWKVYDAQFKQVEFVEKTRHEMATEGGKLSFGTPENYEITNPDGTKQTVLAREVTDPRTGRMQLVDDQGQPISTTRGSVRKVGTKEAGGGLEVSHMFEYKDKDGNTQQVMLREARDRAGWVESDTGKPWTKPEGATGFKQVTAGVAGGGRAGAQLQRQLIAGGEVTRDLENVAQMPVGTTTGLFGNVQPGVSLTGALQGDLARSLTSEDEINMKQAFAGVGRELSTLMSPVYGGNWASEQLEPLIPKAGYTVNNALMGIARIKQSAQVALHSLQTSPIVSADEKALAKEFMKQIDAAIPWDVRNVIAFTNAQNPQESFGDYAARTVGEKQPPSGAASAVPPASTAGSSVDDIAQWPLERIRSVSKEDFLRMTPEQQKAMNDRVLVLTKPQ